jgi:hypothetical protein
MKLRSYLSILMFAGSLSGIAAGLTLATPAGADTNSSPATDSGTGQPTWSIIGSSAPAQTLLLGSTCVDAWDCWSVGGQFEDGGNAFIGVIQHWNGSAWTAVPSEVPVGDNWLFTAVSCVGADDCWAVGGLPHTGAASPFVEHWNGTSWSIVRTDSLDGYFLGVSCSASASCWATGTRTDAKGNSTVSLVEHWNGTSWSIVRTAATGQLYDSLNSIECTGPSVCWAVGWAGPNQQDTNFLPVFPAEAGGRGIIERWNGATWSIVPSPQSPDGVFLSSVTCTGPSDCWAVGAITNVAGFAQSALFEHFDGTSWTSSSLSSLSGSGGDFLRQVDCVSSSDCVAVGGSGLQNGFQPDNAPAAAGWNGSEWSSVATGRPAAFASMLDSVGCAGRSACFAGGFSLTPSGQTVDFHALFEKLDLPQGYSIAGSDGGAFSFGAAPFAGSMGGRHIDHPVVGMSTPDGDGYWLAGSDGGVFSFGDAQFSGSAAGRHLSAPIVGIAAADPSGYWLAGSDGGVFSYGDAHFYGSMAGRHLVAPVVAVAADPGGGGYWLAGSDGGVFSFGDARFHGSMGGKHLAAPVVAMAATPDGGGYWLVGSDGGVFSFGDATFYGSMITKHLSARIVGIVASPDGAGYWLVGSDGGVFSFGDAGYHGSEGAAHLAAPIVAGT